MPFEFGAQTSPSVPPRKGPQENRPKNCQTHSQNLLEVPGAQDTQTETPRASPTPLRTKAFTPEQSQGFALWRCPPPPQEALLAPVHEVG